MVQNVYLEDMSYWQCIQIPTAEIKNCFGKIIINSVEYPEISIISQNEESDCWLYDKEQNLLGLAKIFVRNNDIIWIWSHPKSYNHILNILKSNCDKTVIREDLCRFRILGPQSNAKITKKDLNQPISFLSISDLSLSNFTENNEVILVTQVKGDRESGFGSGYDIIIPKDYAYKFWLDLTHNKVHVGCLDSQEQLDIEIGRVASTRLSHDVL